MTISFLSKNIILATGSHQYIPKNFKYDYSLKNNAVIFTSDFVLKESGYSELVKAVKAKNGKCKICILGGSHSGFSVVYLLLNGPC